MMLPQDRHLAFYGADPGSSALLAHFNQGIMQPDMMCSASNPVGGLHGTFHDMSTVHQVNSVHFQSHVASKAMSMDLREP
jgi:hypothetical protein